MFTQAAKGDRPLGKRLWFWPLTIVTAATALSLTWRVLMLLAQTGHFLLLVGVVCAGLYLVRSLRREIKDVVSEHVD